jgi:ribonuclease D
MITKEIYKDIPGYEKLYQVSNKGNVKSLPKGDGNGYTERLLKFEVTKAKLARYHRITLSKQGKTKRFLVHRLVAQIFINNPETKAQVNHINSITTDNRVENLEWCTGKENMKHSSDLGRQDKPRELGMLRAKEIATEAAIKKYSALLGSNYVNTFTIKQKTYIKRKVTFVCPECKNQYSLPSTATAIARGGICNQCYKGEDIV